MKERNEVKISEDREMRKTVGPKGSRRKMEFCNRPSVAQRVPEGLGSQIS
jgi:hypothetical protein